MLRPGPMLGKCREPTHLPESPSRSWASKVREFSRLGLAAAVGAVVVLLIQGALADQKRAGSRHRGVAAKFQETLATLQKQSVDPIDQADYWEALTSCATAPLDPYSYYVDAKSRARLKEATPFGVSIARRPGHGPEGPLRVVQLDREGPAYRAGLRLGTPIDRINGAAAKSFLKQSQIDLALRPEGAKRIRLRSGGKRYVLNGSSSPGTSRALLETRALRCGSKTCLYAKLARFDAGVAQALRSFVEAHSPRSLGGIVLDLKGNPGGEIDQALALADFFIPSGTLTRVRGRKGQLLEAPKASAEQTLPASVTLVLLVDRYTASAAELLSAALQDHGRALIVGDSTFGKGSIQAMHAFSDGSLLRYTKARYFSPHDHAIDQRGVTPDLHWHAARRGHPLSPSSLCWLLEQGRARSAGTMPGKGKP